MIVRVNVPLRSSFASFCPAMTLAGVKVEHPWVDPRNMRLTGYNPIQSEANWIHSELSLGEAVHAVVEHLQLNPPEILEITDKGLLAIQPPNSVHRQRQSSSSDRSPSRSGSNASHSNGNGHHHSRPEAAPPSYDDAFYNQNNVPDLPPPPPIDMPIIPRSFSDKLKDKPREELETLLRDSNKFQELIQTFDVFHKLQTLSQEDLEKNQHMAQAHLQQEEKMQSLRKEVQRLQKTLQEKVADFQKLEAEQDRLCAPPDVKSTLKALNKAQKQAMDESEDFAENWVEDGASDVDAFVKDFINRRKVHHSRAAKMEVLQQQSRSSRTSRAAI